MAEMLESLVDSFNLTLRVEGKSERTLVLYGQSITYFSKWLVGEGHPADLSSLTRENVRRWLDSLRNRGLSAGTILTRWRGLKRFSRWLVAEGIIPADPLEGISVDKPEPPPVPVYTDEDLAALLRTCQRRSFNDLRDTAIMRLFIDCGMRVSELTGISTDDVHLSEGWIRVTGKGSRVRNAYFLDRTSLALDRYRRARATHKHAAIKAFFLGERGPLTADGVRERMKVRAAEAGLDPAGVFPHRFRHTNAHDFLLAGGQERDLMKLLGWQSEAMLSRYGASAAEQRAREAVRRLKRGDRV